MREMIQPAWSRLAVWLCAFISPTVYFFSLLLADRYHVQIALPENIVASLFFLIPVLALVVCELVVWRSSMTKARKIGWMLFTLVAMALQFGVHMALLVAAIGYAQ